MTTFVTTMSTYTTPMDYSVDTTNGVTTITGNGLTWLSITETDGMQINNVLDDIATNGELSLYYGYETANVDQFTQLLTDYGIDIGTWQWVNVNEEINAATDDFQLDFGLSAQTATSYTNGWIEDTDGNIMLVGTAEYDSGNTSGALERTGIYDNNYTTGSSSWAAGVWLNKSEPVPEPSTIALLSIGIVGLIGGAARKKLKNKAVKKSQVVVNQ